MRFIGLIVLFIALTSPVSAASQWIKLTSTNFELYTSAGSKKAHSTLAYFERIHSFFGRAMKLKEQSGKRIRLVGFRSMKESEPYRMSVNASAHYMRAGGMEYIVLGRVGGQYDPVAVHEYVHLVIDRSELKIPHWLNEGMAEVYSTLRPTGDSVIVGGLPAGRLNSLRFRAWLNLAELVDPAAYKSFMSDRDRMSSFYAQSWLLTHMLVLSPSYRDLFPKFVEALHHGSSTPDAFQSVYGFSLQVVYQDMRDYLSGARWAVKIATKLEKAFINPREETPDEVEIELLLASLLGHAGKDAEAAERYAQLMSSHPDRPELHEALGYSALAKRDMDAAREHFAQAVECGSSSFQLLKDYGMLLQGQPGATEAMIEVLTKATRLNPDDAETQYILGMNLAHQRRHEDALIHLARVKSVKPKWAPGYFRALALCYFEKGDRDQAKIAARRATEYSQTHSDVSASQQMLEYVSRVAPLAPEQLTAGLSASNREATEERPTVERGSIPETATTDSFSVQEQVKPATEELLELNGNLQQLDCLGDHARLRVDVNGKLIQLAIYDPAKVVVHGVEGATAEMACGPQNGKQITVTYRHLLDEELNTVGAVRRILFH